MTKPLMVIKATFSDFKLVKGRKLAQLVFEVPLEAADASLATLGGLPRIDAERWFAIARIDPSTPDAFDKPKDRKPFSSLPLSQQAALKCNDEAFATFVQERYGKFDVVEFVRSTCGVDSRSEIKPGTPAGSAWIELLAEFDIWMRAPA